MQLQIGDMVFHPIHGVGRIAAVKELKLNEEAPRSYYEVKLFNMTVWVLIEPIRIGRLRPITGRSEIARYRRLLKSRPISMDNNFRLRQNDLDNRFKLGTFQAICEIVRDLSARRLLKSLTEFELNLLRRTSEFLFQEWAVMAGVTSIEAATDIEALLMEGREHLN
jgi:RNA polymerase-interacting CarD/CdnL/TRCF family regulator